MDDQAAHTLVSHLVAHGYAAEARGSTVTIVWDGRQVDASPASSEYQGLRSSSPEIARRAVNACLARAGLPGVDSTQYRACDPRRATLKDNFEDIIFRTKAFSRCPNPSPADLQAFTPLARKTAIRVFMRFRLPLKAFGWEADDMVSLAMVHLVTALHRYRCGDAARDATNIGRYLRQRLMEAVRKVQRKAKQCSADTRQRNFADVDFFLNTGISVDNG